jgi:serine/threonine protein kinase
MGGRLLGQGVYGCTFDPTPRCADGSVVRSVAGLPTVGKITIEDSRTELAVGQAIMRLPLAAQYFAVPFKSCAAAAPTEDPDLSACRILQDSDESGARLSMLIMPQGGMALSAWIRNPARLADLKRIFCHLLEGMIVYQDAGFVHNDIHHGNILIDERGVARYIDFGLAFRPADVKMWEDAQLSRNFRPKFMLQAPEVHLWRMMFNGIAVRDGVQQLKAQNDDYTVLENAFPARARLYAALFQFATTSQSYAKKDARGFLRAYGKRFDWWRLGLSMWWCWEDLLAWPGLRSSAIWADRDILRQVLGGMTNFDPRDRMSPRIALRLLDPSNRLAATPEPEPTT